MPEADIANAVQLLTLMFEFFADYGHWTRGRYDDENFHCPARALLHLSRKYSLPRVPAIAVLQDAMRRPGFRSCISTIPVAVALPSCAPSSSRHAASQTIIRRRSGRTPRSKPGCSPDRKNRTASAANPADAALERIAPERLATQAGQRHDRNEAVSFFPDARRVAEGRPLAGHIAGDHASGADHCVITDADGWRCRRSTQLRPMLMGRPNSKPAVRAAGSSR